MARRAALWLILHGAIVMLVGMFVGFPGFFVGMAHPMDDEVRLFYRQSHLIPLATGIWMIAVAGGLSQLSLSDRSASALVWSLVISAYSLVLAQAIWGTALLVGSSVQHPPAQYLYAGALIVTAVGALIGTYLIVSGAYSALKQSENPVRTVH
jgi:hypothetical protein